MATESWKFIIWERLNKMGKWCPYSPEVSQLLEQNFQKSSETVPLGDADDSLKIYTVVFKDLVQVSATTGTKSKVRRRLCDCLDAFCNGFIWQWQDDHNSWHIYDVDVNIFIEKAFSQGLKSVILNKTFRGYHYEIDFAKMLQINKQTKRKRTIRRTRNSAPYPVTKCSDATDDVVPTCPPADEKRDVDYSELAREVPGTTALEQQVNEYVKNVKRTFDENQARGSSDQVGNEETVTQSDDYGQKSTDCLKQDGNALLASPTKNILTAALVNGFPWNHPWPPHTHQTELKPVPGLDPLPKYRKKPQRKKKKIQKKEPENDSIDVLEEYTDIVEINSVTSTEDQVCIICFESLCKGSSYDDDITILQLKLCSHMFHRSCLTAMYNSGPKDKCLQCPVCKKIHGEKCGIQPPGNMIYHVLPYSLPSFHECDTIRIIYDISSGTQGPEHPNPGKKYTARGFPRHCYLPDNEIGRKILRLLIKAWKRRLIFTIGRSSTTGEEDTVTWNEIHHKTEFGCNKRGHGYPDPNYFNNVLSELEAHGIKDDDEYLWYPA